MGDDPRTGTLLTPWDSQQGDCVVIVGFPFDEGVRRNGGRVGAVGGPEIARGFIQKLGTVVNPEFKIDIRTVRVCDSGDIEGVNAELEQGHTKLTERVANIIKVNSIPFIIGGGNDQSFPNAMGLLNNCSPGDTVTVVNIDAHLDVRPFKEGKCHSGSPFFQLLSSAEWKQFGAQFVEFAAQGSQCSQIHVDWVRENGGTVCWLSDIRKQQTSKDYGLPFHNNETIALLEDAISMREPKTSKLFISFDIDSIQGSDCPGVSCPATVGLRAEEALDICFYAGRHPAIALVDISEYNPTIESYRTGRLIANMFYYFLLGRASR